jgi:hypothetical protein
MPKITSNSIYHRICPACGKSLFYKTALGLKAANIKNKNCMRCCHVGKFQTEEWVSRRVSSRCGFRHSQETKKQMSLTSKRIGKRVIWSNEMRAAARDRKLIQYGMVSEREKLSSLVTAAMYRPEVRRRHIDALHKSKWLKVKTDDGQIELIEKWNRLGFQFEINFLLKDKNELFYVDGYDKTRNVVLEFDSKYHRKSFQKKKDMERQEKIISILNPKKFWRYDAFLQNWINVVKEANE